MKKTKPGKCKKCKALVGEHKGYLYGCRHHPIVTKPVPFPKDIKKIAKDSSDKA